MFVKLKQSHAVEESDSPVIVDQQQISSILFWLDMSPCLPRD